MTFGASVYFSLSCFERTIFFKQNKSQGWKSMKHFEIISGYVSTQLIEQVLNVFSVLSFLGLPSKPCAGNPVWTGVFPALRWRHPGSDWVRRKNSRLWTFDSRRQIYLAQGRTLRCALRSAHRNVRYIDGLHCVLERSTYETRLDPERC